MKEYPKVTLPIVEQCKELYSEELKKTLQSQKFIPIGNCNHSKASINEYYINKGINLSEEEFNLLSIMYSFNPFNDVLKKPIVELTNDELNKIITHSGLDKDIVIAYLNKYLYGQDGITLTYINRLVVGAAHECDIPLDLYQGNTICNDNQMTKSFKSNLFMIELNKLLEKYDYDMDDLMYETLEINLIDKLKGGN